MQLAKPKYPAGKSANKQSGERLRKANRTFTAVRGHGPGGRGRAREYICRAFRLGGRGKEDVAKVRILAYVASQRLIRECPANFPRAFNERAAAALCRSASLSPRLREIFLPPPCLELMFSFREIPTKVKQRVGLLTLALPRCYCVYDNCYPGLL
jgi:hypothetical protein